MPNLIAFGLLFMCMCSISYGSKSYTNYSLVKVYIDADEFETIFPKNSFGIQIWKRNKPQQLLDVLVSPTAADGFFQRLQQHGIRYVIKQANIQNAIDEEKLPARINRRSIDLSANHDQFSKFLTLDEIEDFVTRLSKQYQHLVSLETIGYSHMKNPIQVVKVSIDGKTNHPMKPGILIESGTHAREWVAPATGLYILNKILEDQSGKTNQYLKRANWYFIYMVNPDGYNYTHHHDRLWRKNLRPRPQSCNSKKCCDGVDLNRNFDYGWRTTGVSNDTCDETYCGPSAFSEPETQAVRDFLLKKENNLQAYFSLHAYAQMWFYPFGDQKKKYTMDKQELHSLAISAAEALKKPYGTKYEIGTAADLIYSSSGASDDWAKQGAGIKYVYCLELRPDNDAENGFVMSPKQIIPTGEETWQGVSVVVDKVLELSPYDVLAM